MSSTDVREAMVSTWYDMIDSWYEKLDQWADVTPRPHDVYDQWESALSESRSVLDKWDRQMAAWKRMRETAAGAERPRREYPSC